MNHYVGLLILSLAISIVFALISRETRQEQVRFFLTLFGYMALGSLVLAWLMSRVPW